MDKLPDRKPRRLDGYNYSTNGAYFVTICVKDFKCILSTIAVGSDVLDAPKAVLSSYGNVAEMQILEMNNTYENIKTTHYCIMPNHIHMLVEIHDDSFNGASRTSLPTKSYLAKYVSTFKRFCNKKYGENIWQSSYHDHIIRDDYDYMLHVQYIDENPNKWVIGKDKYYA